MIIILSPQISTFYQAVYTFSDDTPHRVELNPEIILSSVNIYCYDNDALIGNSGGLDGIIRANAVVWFDAPCKPFDFMFQNETAGNNAKIVIQGTLLFKK